RPAFEMDLHGGRGTRGIVERADGELEIARGLLHRQRRAARATKQPLPQVRALEAGGRATSPRDIVRGDKNAENVAGRLLAHTAMAHGRAAQPPDAEAHGAALAAAGNRLAHRPPLLGQSCVSWSGC